MKINIPYKATLTNILIIVLIFAEILFVSRPSLETISEIKEKIQLQYTEVNRQLTLGQTTKKILEDLERIKPLLEKISSFFLHEDDQLAYITILENLGAENNIDLTIKLADIPDTPSTPGEIFTIPLSLALQGSYTDTIQFLIELQSLNFYTNIINLSINASTNNNNTVITTNLRANSYWKK